MRKIKQFLICALLLPIVALVGIVAQKQYILWYGNEIILPISGYDPRNMLSGHYLTYRVEYGVDKICPDNKAKDNAYICLEPKMFSYDKPNDCKKLIKGVCKYHNFDAGIESYYIPEDRAEILDQKVRSKSASIVVSITSSGNAQVKNLLVEP